MLSFYQEVITELKKKELSTKELTKLKRTLCIKHNLNTIPTNIEILLHTDPPDFLLLKKKILTKPTRSISGVAPVAIMTKPLACPHGKCTMCPGGPKSYFGDVPQSYTGKEPATMRGIRNNYDSYLQVFNRLEQYAILGHNFEKVELIIMGGTFLAYEKKYQEEFAKYAFKALNDFSTLFFNDGEFSYLKFKQFFELPADLNDPERLNRIHQKLLQHKAQSTLETEQKRNETAQIRCVALCIETKPDYGLLEHGLQLLKLGCTRVELGIQSVYDDVLKKINRGHTSKETIQSLRTLKDLCFKITAHYMPGLPLTDKKRDLQGMKKLFSDKNYRPDMLKIYPCMVSPGTKLYQEFKLGQFTPITAKEAAELIVEFKKHIPEYCRIMRIQRDVPTIQWAAGVEMTNLRQYISQNYPFQCRCIRCREPQNKKISLKDITLKITKYDASKGKEFFIAIEDKKNDFILGFCRLRFPSQQMHPEITKDSALIRELHVYGTATSIGESGNVQHHGFGKQLMQKAEEIAQKHKKNKIIIISGIGVREYYKKLGYQLEGPYMVKDI
ncbi:tRNA uridine(34) 5-carboxymethylaminomethyl modification radical SAM/GNAT enzyme Elp3 [Candidatus Woesearchaeota archaeon]|nr:tRNA uridine(34) 5-carboxymethylaminomethyl modification radical SAM/GNAT enzyme Elp3 [Candidatus Woesearchaeota archaeon]